MPQRESSSHPDTSRTAALDRVLDYRPLLVEGRFGKLTERLVWRSEFQTLDRARDEMNRYIESYHHRPHSGLGYPHPG